MMIALTVHLTAVIAPTSLTGAAKLLTIGFKMLVCAAALWLLLALPGFLAGQDSIAADGAPGGAALQARRPVHSAAPGRPGAGAWLDGQDLGAVDADAPRGRNAP